jgi:hypothetical protein
MLTILRLLFSSLWISLRCRAALQAEILALRHQLLVLQRSAQGRRVRFHAIDRVFWASMISSKAATDYHFKTGQRNSTSRAHILLLSQPLSRQV